MSTKTPKTKFGKQMLYILLPFVLPLCLIILGIVLLANAKVVNGIFLALGILIALVGLVEVVVSASRKKFHPESRYLVTGIILMVIGALLIILPFTINNLIPIILGLSVLGSGISGITNAPGFPPRGYQHSGIHVVCRYQLPAGCIYSDLRSVHQRPGRLECDRYSYDYQRCAASDQRDHCQSSAKAFRCCD